ncbi:hypothetical protein KI387_005427, partial [Taxus chinensis]
KRNSKPDHLSRINSEEEAQTIEETIPDAQLYRLQHAPMELEYIVVFIRT